MKKILLLCALALCSALPAAAADKFTEIRAKIEGTYDLTEWEDGGVTLTPPEVAARFVIRDGKVTWIAHKNEGGKLTSNAQYGDYVLGESVFAYGYGEWLEVVVEQGQTRVSRDPKPEMKSLTLPTMRTFTLTLEKGVVRAVAGAASFEFRDDGMDYTNKNSGFVRRYKRVAK